MAQFNPKEFVICGDNRQYYSYDGELYTGTFPREWVENHLPETGPKDCKNCLTYGSWNGVFIGYCLNCSRFDYKYKRGWGFGETWRFDTVCGIVTTGGVGWERCDEDIAEYDKEDALNGLRACNTYLNINFDDIGDKENFMDSAAVFSSYNGRDKTESEVEVEEYNFEFEEYDTSIIEESEDEDELTEEEFNIDVEEYYSSLYNQNSDEYIKNEEENSSIIEEPEDEDELTEEEFNIAVEEYYSSLYQKSDEYIKNEEENLTQEDRDYIEYKNSQFDDDYCEKNNRSDDDDDDRYYKAINDSYENYQAEIEREDCEEFPEVCDNLYNGYESH